MNQNTELKQLEEKVMNVLSSFPLARNSDKWLVLKVWEAEGIINTDGKWIINESLLPELTTPESITRIRRHIQNDQGILLPTDHTIMVQRRIKEEFIKNYFSEENYTEYKKTKYEVK